jgi:hypothetical protein
MINAVGKKILGMPAVFWIFDDGDDFKDIFKC